MNKYNNEDYHQPIEFIQKITADKTSYDFNADVLALEALDNVSDFVFISDSITKKIVYMNRAVRDVIKLKEGCTPSCYSVFRNRKAPCKHCRNNSNAGEGYIITHNNLKFMDKFLILKSTQFTLDNHIYTISIGKPKDKAYDIAPDVSYINDESNIINIILKTLTKNTSSPNVQIFSMLNFIGQLTRADSVSVYEKRQVDPNLKLEYQRSAFWDKGNDSDVSDNQLLNLPDSFVNYSFTFYRDYTYTPEDFTDSKEIYRDLEALKINSVQSIPLMHGQDFVGMVYVRNSNELLTEKNHAIIQFLIDFISLMVYSRLQSIELDNTRHIDLLTGLKNRSALLIDLKGYSTLKNIGVVSVNINGLQKINQTHGLKQGDKIIMQTGGIISELLKSSSVYRINGDEFLAIYPDTSEKDFEISCDTLRAFLSSKDSFSAAIGSHFTKEGYKILEAVHQAEKKMFANKKEYYRENPNMDRYRRENDVFMDLISPERIKKHIEEHSFKVYYQAKVSLETGKIAGAEALVRLVINDRIIPPNEFITPLDAAHYTYLVDFYVFERVCARIRERLDSGLKIVPVSCNFSRHTFIMKDFIKQLKEIADRYHVPYEMVPLEISEQSNTIYQNELVEVANTLNNLGFKISIDDFGVAHANIYDLAKLPVRELKLDKKLIDSLLGEDTSKIMCILELIITMCKRMNIKTVAEGVEMESQENILKGLGCDEVQGYLHCRPIDEKTFYQKVDTEQR